MLAAFTTTLFSELSSAAYNQPAPTEASLQAEINSLQSKLDDILYPNFFKTLERAFKPGDVIFGGYVENSSKDDVLFFHSVPKD